MKVTWTPWAAERAWPLPGHPHTARPLVVDHAKSAARIAKAGGGALPTTLVLADEIDRGVTLRLAERYNDQGNIPKDALGDDLVDLWVARAGVAFALEALVGVTRTKTGVEPGARYELRRDAKPWPRLREHAIAAGTDLASFAQRYFPDDTWECGKSELPFALAFLSCRRDWIDKMLDEVEYDHPDYGQQCMLAAITDPALATTLVHALADNWFHLYEEGPEFVPTVMQILPDSEADFLVSVGEKCPNKAIRKPWLEIIGSLTTPKAKAFVAKYANPPPAKAPTATKKPKKSTKPTKPTKKK